MRKDGDIGHKLGPRLADLAARGHVAARTRLWPIEHKLKVATAQTIFDRIGAEIAELYAPHARQILESDDLTPETRRLLERAASGEHQWQAITGFALSQSGASASIGQLLANDVAPTIRGIIARSPGQIPDAATIATMGARNLMTETQARHNIAEAGFDDFWASMLLALSETVASPDQLYELHNRGLLSEAELHDQLGRYGIATSQIPAIASLAEQILAPADAALAVLRGNMTHAQGLAVAKSNGVSAADFEVIIGNTGEPLPLEALLEAKRRGFIDDTRLVRGILQSRTRNEWVDVAEKLSASPMSTADAVAAAVQGHISIAEARAKAVQNGLEASDFQALYDTAGEPLSRTEMEQLYNRGLVSEAEVKQALKESRIKNKYVDHAFALHTRLPEGRQVVTMITHGALTKAKGTEILIQLGYTKELAAALVASGTAAKLGPHHELAMAQIRELYAAAIISRAKAEQLLSVMGYDAHDAALLLTLWEQLAGQAITMQAVGVARARYVAHVIDNQGASDYLHSLGMPASAIARYLKVWTLERDVTVRQLTEAQIVGAVKKSLITQSDGHARLTRMGYAAGDANVLLGMTPAGGPPGG
jgi:hypothetical protein